MEKSLLIATSNPGKMKEIKSLLQGVDIQLLFPDEIKMDISVEESGSSYEENALLKARTYAQLSHMMTLADDTGLEVAALGGLPGLHSHRLAPDPHAEDAERRAILLEKLSSYPKPWKARFVCKVVLYKEGHEPLITSGFCDGEIIREERGSRGFGFDPIFYFPEINKTMAEMTLLEKNQVSHRAMAINKMIPFLLDY